MKRAQMPPGLGVTESGKFDRATDIPGWLIPSHVECKDDLLTYRLDDRSIRKQPKGDVLLKFSSLHLFEEGDAFRSQVQRFAEKFGTLQLCRHGRPFTHNQPRALQFWHSRCVPMESAACPGSFCEPLYCWRRYSNQFAAILKLSGQLKNDEHYKREDWKLVDEDAAAAMIHPDWQWDRAWLLGYLSQSINSLLSDGDVRPRFSLIDRGNQPRISLVGEGLFGYLATQLSAS